MIGKTIKETALTRKARPLFYGLKEGDLYFLVPEFKAENVPEGAASCVYEDSMFDADPFKGLVDYDHSFVPWPMRSTLLGILTRDPADRDAAIDFLLERKGWPKL